MDHTTAFRRTTRQGRCEEQYQLELARGASHIASTTLVETRDQAISDVKDAFVHLYGNADLPVFLAMLADRLRGRGAFEEAAAVVSASQNIYRRRRARAQDA
jgi:hypothetical protein